MYSTSPSSVPARQEEVGGGGEKEWAWVQRKKSQTSQTQTSWFTQTSHDTMYIYCPEYNRAQLREKPVDHLVLRLWCTSAANQDFSTSKINNLQLVAGMASCSVNSTVNINSNSNLRPALQSLPPVRTDQLCKACTPINSPRSNKCSQFPHHVRRGVVARVNRNSTGL